MSSDKNQNSAEQAEAGGGGFANDRHRSRELALSTLYACEVDPSAPWEQMLDSIAENDSLGPNVKKYAAKLVGAVVLNMASIDPVIAAKAANWEMRRMAAIDRNLLRLATAELVYFKDSVPFKVVIDEAVEIAKVYGTDDSGKFVNGILDSVRRDLYSRKTGKNYGKEEEEESAAT
jgi:N utilization substance protein B